MSLAKSVKASDVEKKEICFIETMCQKEWMVWGITLRFPLEMDCSKNSLQSMSFVVFSVDQYQLALLKIIIL